MVTQDLRQSDKLMVHSMDGQLLPNGQMFVAVDNASEQLQGRAPQVGWVDHNNVPHNGDVVKVDYWPCKDGRYGKTWKWAN